MKLEADLHTHTLASDGYSTLQEMVEAAALKGLRAIAITDHGLKMPCGTKIEHFANMHLWPLRVAGVRLLRGVEANILDASGRIDLPEGLLEKLDVVLAGFHSGTGYASTSVEENTRAMIAAIKNPYVQIISHPGNPQFPIDTERVVLAAKAYGKALELNNSSFTQRPGSITSCHSLARLAKKHGVRLVINSDAHISYSVGECATALTLAEEVGVDPELVVNSSLERLLAFLGEQRRVRNSAVLEKLVV